MEGQELKVVLQPAYSRDLSSVASTSASDPISSYIS